jgi:hypothetical protein
MLPARVVEGGRDNGKGKEMVKRGKRHGFLYLTACGATKEGVLNSKKAGLLSARRHAPRVADGGLGG